MSDQVWWIRRHHGASTLSEPSRLGDLLLASSKTPSPGYRRAAEAVVAASTYGKARLLADSTSRDIVPELSRRYDRPTAEWAATLVLEAWHWRGAEQLARRSRRFRAEVAASVIAPAVIIALSAAGYWNAGEDRGSGSEPDPAAHSPSTPADPPPTVTTLSAVTRPETSDLRFTPGRQVEGVTITRRWELTNDEFIVTLDIRPDDDSVGGVGSAIRDYVSPGPIAAYATQSGGREPVLEDFDFDSPAGVAPGYVPGSGTGIVTFSLSDFPAGRTTRVTYSLPIDTRTEATEETLLDWYEQWSDVVPEGLEDPPPIPTDI